MTKHLLNLRQDPFDERDHIVMPNAPTSVVDVDFRPQVPYVKNQLQKGSCIGHGVGSLFELNVRQRKSNVPASYERDKIRVSPEFLYDECRILDGDFSEDNGSTLRTAFKIMTKIGVCLESTDPYKEQMPTCQPTLEMRKEAANFKFGAFHRITDVETAKSVLVSGYSFAIGIPLFQQFDSDEAAETGMIAMPTYGQTSIGGHCMYTVGAKDSINVLGHQGAFIVGNSWDEKWGDKGFCYIPYDYFQVLLDQADLWVGHFGRPWVAKKPIKVPIAA